jgi:hypothetical protein
MTTVMVRHGVLVTVEIAPKQKGLVLEMWIAAARVFILSRKDLG